jgi:hypothetical protein
MYRDRSRLGRLTFLGAALLLPLLGLLCGGCDALGVVASTVVGPSQIAPAYSKLKGQRVAIMVWADEGLVVDHPSICADVAGSLQNKLQQGVDAKVDELKGTTFMGVQPVLRYQEEHPESQADSAEQIATRFPATRFIYIEVESLSLHPGDSLDLSRGQAVADVKVVEVNNGRARTAYDNDSVSAVYPPNSPPEGLPNLDDDTVFRKTVDALTTELGKLFITHPDDSDHAL